MSYGVGMKSEGKRDVERRGTYAFIFPSFLLGWSSCQFIAIVPISARHISQTVNGICMNEAKFFIVGRSNFEALCELFLCVFYIKLTQTIFE